MKEVNLCIPDTDFAFFKRLVKGLGWKYIESLITKRESYDEDEDLEDNIIVMPEWDEDDIASVSLDEVMNLDWFEENILKCDIRTLARLPRNEQGHSRIATRKVRVWLCDDCFPDADPDEEPELYKEQATKLKVMPHIVTMTKPDPQCRRSEWYKIHDGERATDAYGKMFKVDYAKEMKRINYFIHVDSFSGEDTIIDLNNIV